MTIEEIVRRVRQNLDEASVNESEMICTFSNVGDDTALGGDELHLDDLIASKAEEALTYVYTNADPSLLEGVEVPARFEPFTDERFDAVDIAGRYVATIPKYNFVRLLDAYVDSWSHAVSDVLPVTDAEYQKQKNWLTVASPDEPAVFLRYYKGVDPNGPNRPGIARVTEELVDIELYSAHSVLDSVVGAGQKEFPSSRAHVRCAVLDRLSQGEIDVYVRVEDAFIYYLTALVMNVLHDTKADDMAKLAQINMGVAPPAEAG